MKSKSVIVISSILSGVLFLLFIGLGHCEPNVKVKINERLIEEEAKLIDGRTYLPIRAVGEALGAEVSWNSDTNTAEVSLINTDEIVPEVLNKVSPCVVGIIGNLKDDSVYADYRKHMDNLAHGTGVIINEDGKILTNAHVVGDLERIIVVLVDGNGYEAELIAIDEESDLALIQIQKNGLPTANFAKDEDIIIGKTIIAIGTPISFSLRNSASIGIISGMDRGIGSAYRLIQTDAAINPGNSGGPLVNLQGEIIGINSNKFMGLGIEGLGFSIPISTVKYVLSQFEKYGKVIKPYLGADFEEGWAARVGLPSNEGLTILAVRENSPAKKAGLNEGDILLSINDYKVNSIVDFNEEMKKYNPEERISVKIKRESVIQNINVLLEVK